MSTYRPDIDPEVEAIVGRMLQVDPSDRYPTYGALIADIRTYLRRADPSAVQMDGMFADEAPKKPRTPFFHDIKSQIMLLLVLIAIFPYMVFFYARPMLFPAAGVAGKEVGSRKSKVESPTNEGTGNREEGTGESTANDGNQQTLDSSTVISIIPSDSNPEQETVQRLDGSTDKRTNEHTNERVDEGTGNREQETEDNHQTDEGTGNEERGTVQRTDDATAQRINDATNKRTNEPTMHRTDDATNKRTNEQTNKRTDAAQHTASDEVIDLTVEEPPAPPVTWPSIKVGAIIGGGADGGALVNGQVIPIGYQLPNGAILRSVEPQSATFEYKGQTKKFFVSKPKKAPPPDKNGNRSKGVKK